MKLMELSQLTNKTEPGVYSAVRFSPNTVKTLEQYSKINKIPNPVEKSEYHCTVLYSPRPLPNFEAIGKINPPMIGIPDQFEIWPSNSTKKNVLVLRFSCPPLYQYYHKTSLKHGAPSDYDIYNPHVTLSYDVGDFQIEKLPKFDKNLEIVEEYSEELSDE